MTITRIRRFPDLGALSQAAADELTSIAHGAVAARGTCAIALSGGSTPRQLFKVLSARGRDAVPWDHIELWWGDERCVPPGHLDSNFGSARSTLIEPLALEPSRIHRMRGEDADPERAAREYETALVTALGTPPRFDLVMLGLGSDGHTASLFPGSPALAETDRYVVANPVAGRGTRITLTAPAINAAHHVLFIVAGADKAAAVAGVLQGPSGVFPAQLITNATWLIDHAAARELR